MKASFITTVAIEYRHSYTEELCRTLGIFVILKLSIPLPRYGNIHIRISTDCQAVINILNKIDFPVSFNSYLYQIQREIGIIVREIGAQTSPVKVVAH